MNDEAIADTRPVIYPPPDRILHTKSVLGREIGLFIQTPMPRPYRFFLMLLGMVAVLLPLILGVMQFQIMDQKYGYNAALQRSQVWIFLSIVSFILFFLFILIRSRHSTGFVALHQYGIRYRLNKKRIYWLLYQNISGLQEELIQEKLFFIPIRQRCFINILPKNSKIIRLTSPIANLPELYASLKRMVNPFLLRATESAVNSGQWVEFGEVKVNQSQFCYRDQIIHLGQIHEISIHSGKLRIMVNPQAYSSLKSLHQTQLYYSQEIYIPLSKIVNLEIFLAIMQTRIGP